MAEVLLQVLNGDQLEEAARGTRDHFLKTLQAHICDVNGFVRSRVLQLFTRIVQGKVNVLGKRLCLCLLLPSSEGISKGISVTDLCLQRLK